MKFFGRRKPEGSKNQLPQEPRLSGMHEPHHSKAASDAFIEVIMRASDAQGVGRIGVDHQGDVDRATALKEAVKSASRFCNGELLARLRAFQNAVIEQSMGGGSAAEVDAARKHFTSGCRQALGNDT